MTQHHALLAALTLACAPSSDGEPSASDENATDNLVDTDPTDSDPPQVIDTDVADTDASDTDGGDTDVLLGPDLRLTGPEVVDRTVGDFTASSGCVVHWQRFTPTGGSTGALVVLTHGLERTEQQMTVWARHLASWGLDVVAPHPCHTSVIDLDQVQNAVDLVELAAALRPGPVVYGGHSAGGLASWVAASRDPSTVGLFGLDPTEWLGIGAEAAPLIEVPTYGLLGDAGVCNAFGSGAGLLSAIPGAVRRRVVDADHCDFECPTGPLCTPPCGRSPNDTFTETELRATVIGLTTAALLQLAGVDAAADVWWASGGPWHDRLWAEGRIR